MPSRTSILFRVTLLAAVAATASLATYAQTTPATSDPSAGTQTSAPATPPPAPDTTAAPQAPSSQTSTSVPQATMSAPVVPTPENNPGMFAPARTGPGPSRVDLFGGYGYFHPTNSDINNYPYPVATRGAVASVAGYFNRFLGLQAEGSFFPGAGDGGQRSTAACYYTAQAGPIARFQYHRFVPFVHALGGGAKVGGPVFQPCTWGWGVTGGTGFDYILPFFNDHLALRPIQADFNYSQVLYGPLVLPAGVSGGFGEIHAYRLASGLVVRFGDLTPPPPVTLTCAVNPSTIYPGEPLTISASPTMLDRKKVTSYTWKSTGGTVTGASVGQVATTGLAPGTYTISGHVSQGNKPAQNADCTAQFILKDFEPPTISCSADPSTVTAGTPSNITALGRSPQNRTLTYSYTASSGQVTGTGPTASLATAGVSPGSITVTCNVVDDLGKSAQATTSVEVTPPVVPPAVTLQPLCRLTFDRDKKRPNRVDNESKACLDSVALALNRDTTSKLVVTGKYAAEGESTQNAAERAANVRQYLTNEKGIDPSRIELRTGDSSGRAVENTLVPSGATFDDSTTTVVDATTITQHGQAYGKPRPAGSTPVHHRRHHHRRAKH